MAPAGRPSRGITVPWREPPDAPLLWQTRESTTRESTWTLGPLVEQALLEERGESIRVLPTRNTRRLAADDPRHGPSQLLIKEFRETGPLARARRILGFSRAAVEWRRSRELTRAGIAHPAWLAWGRTRWTARRPRDVLVGPYVEEGCPLEDLARRCLDSRRAELEPERLRELTRQVGKAVGLMHRAGFVHRDLHPGNLLVTSDLDILLVDLHRSRRRNSSRARLNDLTDLGHGFLARTSRTARRRFLRAYHQALSDTPDRNGSSPRHVERAALASLRRFTRKREGRALRSCRQFRRLILPGLGGIAARTPLASRLTDTLDLRSGEDFGLRGEVLHARRGARVLRCATRRGPVCVKIYEEAGPAGLIKRILRGSRAKRAWLGYHRLALRGVPVPQPLLYLEEPWYMPRRRSLVATGFVEEASHLAAWLAHDSTTQSQRHLVSHRLARALRSMHDLGARNRDLKAENILVSPFGPGPVVIDPDGVRLHRPGDSGIVAADLARLNASFPPGGSVSPRERLEFLDAYLRDGLDAPPPRRELRRAIEQRTREKWQC